MLGGCLHGAIVLSIIIMINSILLQRFGRVLRAMFMSNCSYTGHMKLPYNRGYLQYC